MHFKLLNISLSALYCGPSGKFNVRLRLRWAFVGNKAWDTARTTTATENDPRVETWHQTVNNPAADQQDPWPEQILAKQSLRPI